MINQLQIISRKLTEFEKNIKELKNGYHDWVSKQCFPVEVAAVTTSYAIGGAAYGVLFGTVGQVAGHVFPNLSPAIKGYCSSPMEEARVHAALQATCASITCAMKRIRGKEDVQTQMAAGFGAGAMYRLMTRMGRPYVAADAVILGVVCGLIGGIMHQLDQTHAQPGVEYTRTRCMLSNLGLQNYEKNFEKGLLTDITMHLLTESALKDVGVPPGPRLLILDNIARDPELQKMRQGRESKKSGSNMSWYRDPELFIYYWDSSYGYGIGRIVKKFNVPLNHGDITYDEGQLNFYKHLSLGNNRESDYAALKSHLVKNVDVVTHENVKYVNSQGLVVNWAYKKSSGTWSRVEELNSIFYSLPGIINPSEAILAEKRAVEIKNSELKAEITLLKAKLNEKLSREQALEKQVTDLSTELEECRAAGGGSADVQPWMSGDAIPSHWVRFEDLDVLHLPKNTPMTIMEELGKPKFVEDATTNVQVHRFYRGTFIVAVNVAELTPDNEKARFDPDIWGLYKNAGVSYAARKPLESEMSVSITT